MQSKKKKSNGVIAIIPAAGLGKRFGGGKGKTFRSLLGLPIVVRTLEAFQRSELIDGIVPVFREEELQFAAGLIERYGLTKVRKIAAGGVERQDSVYNGLKALEGKASIVVIHDGARPLVDVSLIEDSIRALNNCAGVITAVPVKDTIKTATRPGGSKNIYVQGTPDRSILWSVQTPQTFRLNKLLEAYEKAYAEGFYATDDAALIERYGGRVKIVMGSYRNLKITTPEDLMVAETFLKEGK